MGTEVNPFDIFKGGKNAGRSGYNRGKMRGERLGDSLNNYRDKNPRLISAIAGIFFFVLGFLFLKYGEDMDGQEYAVPIVWGMSAIAWLRFYWLGHKKKRQSEMEEDY